MRGRALFHAANTGIRTCGREDAKLGFVTFPGFLEGVGSTELYAYCLAVIMSLIVCLLWCLSVSWDGNDPGDIFVQYSRPVCWR